MMDLSSAQPSPLRRNQSLRILLTWLVDAVAWTVGLVGAIVARYEFDLRVAELTGVTTVVLLALALHTLIGHMQFLYRGRYGFGTFEEVRAVSVTVLLSAILLFAFDVAEPLLSFEVVLPRRAVPASAPIVGAAFALVIMLGVRYMRRLQHDRQLRPDANRAAPVLLFGAGAAGQQLLRSMLSDPGGRYVPVGLLDDDPGKRHLRIHGIDVLGGRNDIAATLHRTGAGTVIVAVANADAMLVREVRRLTLAAGATLKVLPSVSELLDAKVGVADVRDVQVSDVLGRHQIETDLESIAGYLRGKRVLVTGAGGSIGSELCRQIDRFNPGELMMLDRDESALHAVQLSLRGRALLDGPELILADLRDAERIRGIFAARRPQVVFHAAALKHLPLLERHPGEAVKSNIWGTLGVLEAAYDVEKFVNISTDKAANPTSVLGYSKRITERLTAHASTASNGTFLNVRFGNVLGSRGSVLTAFNAQIAAGGPITVTHPEVTRYFMTVQEAVQLVIQAAAIGRDGEALVLEMGAPVRIDEVARQLAEYAGVAVDIVYTGLRPGEKLHEDLFGDGEVDVRPLHPLISHVDVPPLEPTKVRFLDPYSAREDLIRDMKRLAADRDPAFAAVPHQALSPKA
jgi:FlaA1/EpsC-like NDP-sugar epimerase